MMKDTASGTICLFRFTILVLLLFSCIPLTLISGTGAAASSLSGAGPRGAAVSNAARLTDCRVCSSTNPEQLDLLQHALSNLVIEVSDPGKVTAKCQGSYLTQGDTYQTIFQMSGNKEGNYLSGTFTFSAIVSGSWIGIKQNGSFKSEDVTKKTGLVTVHFYITEIYALGSDGKKFPPADGVTTGSFDAVFTPVGFVPATATTKPADDAKKSKSDEDEDGGSDKENFTKLAHNAKICFIATAAYGSQTAPQLDTLRAFRDKVLMKSEAGTWFVETYYYLSPPLADFIADKDALRWIVRLELIDPIVFILKNSQQIWNN
jgi:hypothetical protein